MKALITGASSGIGADMAYYLNSLGYDLYVVSRNKKTLDKMYQGCYGKVTTIELDLSKEENCYKLYDRLKDEHIDILVNNAGFGDAGNFTETVLTKEIDMINLNIKAYHILTKLFLTDFTKRNYGRILNVASMAGFMPGPYMATYYATKSYIVNLSLGIAEELKDMNSKVKISVFCPGPVKTNFVNVAHVHFNIGSLTSTKAAQIAIDGMFTDKLIILPNNMKINYFLTKVSPMKMILKINSMVQERASK
ncbi:MAG: SDR family NAD(P)-dependent oxidoreductase [Bacilli bacterium]|nr:SDR family NAD(P)-dependent oxidoreductase [Bacilli bacterium]